ncbi:MAG: zf-HC2 domain-containing protein [Planctomycetota bacterium]
MSCEQAKKLFSLEIEGELESKHQQWLESHMRDCDSCAAARRRFHEGVDALRSLPRHPVPRRFAEDVVEAAALSKRPRVATGRWQWAAMLVICAAVMFVLLAWQESRWRAADRQQKDDLRAMLRPQEADKPTTDTTAEDSVLAELRGVSDQLRALSAGVVDQDRQLAELVAAANERGLLLNNSIVAERELREADVRMLQSTIDTLTDRLAKLQRSATDGWAEQVATLGSQLRAGMNAIDERLQSVEDGWQHLQPLLARAELASQGDYVGAEAPSHDGTGAPGEGMDRLTNTETKDWLTQLADAEATAGPCRVLRRNGAVRLLVNFEHPDAVPTLLTLYRAGAPAESRLALAELDKLYGQRARSRMAAKREDRGFLDRIRGTGRVRDDADLERQRVDIYEDLWREDLQR